MRRVKPKSDQRDLRLHPRKTYAGENAEFEVFLSFCGKDTRKGFTDHLYENLTQRGVKTFIDSKNLLKGEKIDLLHRYVHCSKVFLPVFSKGYADSKWCLRELSTAVKCEKKTIPVFFNVEPSDLIGNDGCFGRSFKEHANNQQLDQQEVKGWVDACKKAGSISGHHLQNDAAGYEAKLIGMIVKDVMTCVATNLLDVGKHPVGLKPRVEEIKGLLLLRHDLEGNDVVRMIGIYGMGGIGKTTLAKAVHNEIARKFDACSFLPNVRETSKTDQGLRSLETQMIRDISREGSVFSTDAIKRVASHKKVLVVLDDVDHLKQLKALAGGCDWFGKGSRIIITTRDKKVLIDHKIREGNMYAIDVLSDDHCMELFSYHAFVSKQPPDARYKQLAKEVVCTAGGLPLALEVLGSQFFDMKNPEEWDELIRKLQKYPSKDVYDRLRISYDELQHYEKEVFLDIACFFMNRQKDYPILMWEACAFYPSFAIKVLVHKSLIKMTNMPHDEYDEDDEFDEWGLNLSGEGFSMHDQICDMGRNIVLQERGSLTKLAGRHSRLWGTMTIEELQMMEEPMSVQGIKVSKWGKQSTEIPANLWKSYTHLRYLCVHGVTFQGNCLQLPDSLKWLSLIGCELEQPSTPDFDPGESVVILDLAVCSHLACALVEQSLSHGRKGFEKLKVLDLSRTNITTTPDFSNVPCPNLEKMILCNCRELTTVHESIGQLKRLEILDLRRCTKLSSLPITHGDMTSLKILRLEGCENLSSLPYTLNGMASLEVLLLNYTGIETLPDFIGELKKLKKISLRCCEKLSSLPNTLGGMTSLEELVLLGTNITTLPDSIGELRNLKELSLGCCEKLSSLPNTLGGMTSLEVLVVDDTYEETLPGWIVRLRNLQKLGGCTEPSSLLDPISELTDHRQLYLGATSPNLIGGLTNLHELYLSCTLIETLPDSVGALTNLRVLDLSECERLSSLPETLGDMTSLEVLELGWTSIKTLPDSIGELTNLHGLRLNHTRIEALPDSVGALTNLQKLDLSGCQSLSPLPNTLWDMTSLEVLFLGNTSIKTLPDSIGELTNLHELRLSHTGIETLPDSVGALTNLQKLDLSGCQILSSLPNTLGDMTSLEVLKLDDTIIETLPGSIGELAKLEKLCLGDTWIETLSDSIGELKNLHELDLQKTCIETLPDSIGELTNLQNLYLSGCESLSSLPNTLGDMTSLKVLKLDDTNIETLPGSIGELAKLCWLSIRYCAELKVLPHSIRKLSSLLWLEIDGTPLKGLKNDHGIEDLMKLDELNLSSCELLYVLPNHFLCERLRRLHVNDPTVETLPESMGQWANLQELSLNCEQLRALPKSMGSLYSLEKLEVSNCGNLSFVPRLPTSLTQLSLVDCIIKVETICISHLKSLTEINLHGCSLLKGVPGTGNNNDIMRFAFVEQSWGRGKGLDRLKVLDISQTGITATPDFNNLQCPGLEKLILRNCQELKLVHESVTELSGLVLLDLTGCHQLSTLPNRLGSMTSLVELVLDCTNIKTLPDSMGNLSILQLLSLDRCRKLSSLPNTLGSMTSLEKLVLDCSSVETIPVSIAALTNLRKLFLTCYNRSPFANRLSSLPLLPPSLVELKILGCITNVETMASVSHLTSLTSLWLCGCPSLKDVPGLENIVNNLEELILPMPSTDQSLYCDVLNDHFRKTIFQEATFDALCTLSWLGGFSFVKPGAGRQHRFDFMLPRHILFTSCKEVTGRLRSDVVFTVNDDGKACWKAHVDVVDDDDRTIVPSKSYNLLPRQIITFWDANSLVTAQAIDLGRSCTVRVSLELPREPVELIVSVRVDFQR